MKGHIREAIRKAEQPYGRLADELEFKVYDFDEAHLEEKMNRIRKMRDSMKQETSRWRRRLPTGCRKIWNKLNGPLLIRLCREAGLRSDALEEAMEEGFRVSSFMRMNERRCTGPLRKKVQAVRSRLNFDPAVWEATLKEVDKGWLVEVDTKTAADAEICLAPRFGVVQEGGIRVCDDFSFAGLNDSTEKIEKIKMDLLSDLAAVTERRCKGRSSGMRFWKEDLAAAYRQVAVHEDDKHFLHTAVMDTHGTVRVFRHTAMPFGAAASVFNFHAVGLAIVTICREILHIPVCRFVDDFFCCGREGDEVEQRAFRQLLAILGFNVKEEKSRLGFEVEILGSLVQLKTINGSPCFSAKPTQRRIDKAKDMIRMALSRDGKQCDAQKLCGVLNSFPADRRSSARSYRWPLYRWAERGRTFNDRTRRALRWWLKAVEDWGPMEIELDGDEVKTDAVVYNDATGVGDIGGLQIPTKGGDRKPTWWAMSYGRELQKLERRCYARKTQIMLYELIALVQGIAETAREKPQGKKMYMDVYCDNAACFFALLKGYSRVEDICRIIEQMNLYVTKHNIFTRYYYVKSEDNVADIATRKNRCKTQEAYDKIVAGEIEEREVEKLKAAEFRVTF